MSERGGAQSSASASGDVATRITGASAAPPHAAAVARVCAPAALCALPGAAVDVRALTAIYRLAPCELESLAAIEAAIVGRIALGAL